MKILVTGAYGFVGKNLVAWLQNNPEHEVYRQRRQDSWSSFANRLASADIIFHLAGTNRPQSEYEFELDNVMLTQQICDHLLTLGQATPIVFSSSIQAELDNPYGLSKRHAEKILTQYATQSGAQVAIYRLPNVFGKWCRPNYNSVVATFCHNIAHNQPIIISDINHRIQLVYVDDVVCHFIAELNRVRDEQVVYPLIESISQITLGELAEKIRAFQNGRETLIAPNFTTSFVHQLYATYLSYQGKRNFGYQLEKRSDQRGSLAEFIKQPGFGQVFVSRTQPGITRGNHYHHTKTEKFLVLEGKAVVRFRHLEDNEVLEYPVCGEDYQVIDIPPGYTHSIENVGAGQLVTLFWASELFDHGRPDTYALPVFLEDM